MATNEERYVAARVEEEFSKCILKDSGIKEELKINELFLLADGNRRFLRKYTQEQVDKINDNWDKLERDLHLENDVYYAIETLKSRTASRVNITSTEISERLKSDFSRHEEDKNISCRLLVVLNCLEKYS